GVSRTNGARGSSVFSVINSRTRSGMTISCLDVRPTTKSTRPCAPTPNHGGGRSCSRCSPSVLGLVDFADGDPGVVVWLGVHRAVGLEVGGVSGPCRWLGDLHVGREAGAVGGAGLGHGRWLRLGLG